MTGLVDGYLQGTPPLPNYFQAEVLTALNRIIELLEQIERNQS